MARPQKEGLDYFPHDTDAVNDEKIEALRAMYHNDGYAFYFILLERIYRTNNAKLDLSNKAVKLSVVNKIGISEAKFDEMMETALILGCFEAEDYQNRNVVTSKGIKKRFAAVETQRERWRKRKSSSEVFQVENLGSKDEENEEETPENKVKKSKENKIKEKKKSNTLIDFYHDKFLEKFGVKPVINGAKDGAIFKKLLNTYNEEQIKELLEKFFASDDKFIKSSGYTVGVFGSVINKLLIESVGSPKLASDIDPGRERARLLEESL